MEITRIDPMLCQSATASLLDDDTWTGELKADGTRIWLEKEDDDTFCIFNRKGVEYTDRLPELIEAAKRIPAGDFILDGEACWFDENGRTLFKGSQVRCSTQDKAKQKIAQLKYPIVMLAFDILSLDGRNVEHWPLEERKMILDDILRTVPPDIRSLKHTTTRKRALYDEVVARGEEGLILKRSGSRYERGKRSNSWMKVKKWYSERVLVIGYTEGTGARKDLFGSLILAREDDEGYLRYCGKVGTGFNNAELKQVTKILREYEVEKELVEVPDPHQPVKAPLEVTVKFYETTSGGVFRFPAVLKDSRGINQIHFNGDTIPVKLRPRDLRSMLGGLK